MNCNICNKEFDSFKELTRHLIKEHNYTTEDIYKYFNYSFEEKRAYCPICGKEFKMSLKQLRKHKKGLNVFIGCCSSCSASFRSLVQGSSFSREDVRKKSKQTMLERYGVEHSLQSAQVREKVKKTNLERYGVENVTQSPIIQEKTRKTNLERYGVERPSQSKKVQEKMEKTMMERYGVKHAAQSKEFLEKMQETTMKRYGVKNASSSPEVKEKRKQTFLERYGVDSVCRIEEFKEKNYEKMKQTNLRKYGVEYPAQSKEIREHMKKTNLEKYGQEYTVRVPEFIEKSKQTNIDRYGVDNAFKNEQLRKKAQETNMKKYGVKHASQSPEIQERIRESNLEKYGVEYFCQHEDCISANGHRISKLNKNFHEFLLKSGIENELEFIVENLGYDLKVGNTLIEIDPYFTHNTTKGPCFGGKEREAITCNYHLEKTNFAKGKGYNCIHVFDWEDWDKIAYLFQKKKKIPARKCEVREINRKEADEFLGSYHLQGATKQLQYAHGLLYEGELVEVMTFGKPRYNKNYEYELLRLCAAPEVFIVGGASKLLKFFEEQVKPESIISYCDLSKFNGGVYKKLGFELKEQTAPARHWYNSRTKRHITDNLLRQRGFDQLHSANFGKGTSNEELMKAEGYVEIYDCGQLVFVKRY